MKVDADFVFENVCQMSGHGNAQRKTYFSKFERLIIIRIGILP